MNEIIASQLPGTESAGDEKKIRILHVEDHLIDAHAVPDWKYCFAMENSPGTSKVKKTDTQHCQGIQKLHTLGFLSGSFLPDEATEHLRTYCGHRTNLVEQAADTPRQMQKYLRLLNLRLDIVVKDITGLTGPSILDAVCKGEVFLKIGFRKIPSGQENA